MSTIALIDPYWEGHHPAFFRLFTKKLLHMGHDVIALCPVPLEVSGWIADNYAGHMSQLQSFELRVPQNRHFPIEAVRSSLDTLKLWKRSAEKLQQVILKTGRKPKLVFFPWLDSYLNILIPTCFIDRSFPWRWSGLYFHPSHLRLKQRSSFIKSGIFDPANILSSLNCCSVAVLDEGISNQLQKNVGHRPVQVFPDIADGSAPERQYAVAHEIREKASGRKIIGLIGSLEKRKGLLTMIKLAQRTCKENWFYVFCGKLYKNHFAADELRTIEDFIQSAPSNCFFHFDYIESESRFNALVDICDILFAVYENFYHSSNILAKAAHFRKKVLVHKGSCMEERVNCFQLGLSVESGNVNQCIDALIQLFGRTDNLSPDYEGFLSLHSEDRLISAFEVITRSAGNN